MPVLDCTLCGQRYFTSAEFEGYYCRTCEAKLHAVNKTWGVIIDHETQKGPTIHTIIDGVCDLCKKGQMPKLKNVGA